MTKCRWTAHRRVHCPDGAPARRSDRGPSMATVNELHINGAKRPVTADPDRTLLSVLRDDLGLTGSKYGCGEGKCGACTVLIDGQSTRSCVTRVGTLAGKEVHTIESLS